MAISGFKGPLVSFGAEPSQDGNEWRGPSVLDQSYAVQDPRPYTNYAGGNWVVGWFNSGRGLLTIDTTPATINATCIAATQSAATAVTLASANNSTANLVVGASFVNVNTGALVTGAVAIECPNATATGQFLAYGASGSAGQAGVNIWDPTLMAARVLTVTAAGTDSGRTVTFAGNDIYGVPITQTVTLANTSAVATTKAFKYIRTATLDALPTGGISIGIGTVYGLPLRADTLAFVDARLNTTSAVAITAAVTSAANATTGDVRGTFIAATTGANRLTVYQAVSAANISSTTGLIGVAQF